jgi:hypothetical protein
MSAANWARCPRCTRRHAAGVSAAEALYGQVPRDDYEAGLAEASRPLDWTFREDYEVCGAATGMVTVGYSGVCEKCGLSLSFDGAWEVPGWNEE